ncbi:MAG: endo-1,4-beta-xylanase [Lachnospiraceae bacterium]|nr:endo-1,4-beta-xylanase [Lachnospiraceae bacterium]
MIQVILICFASVSVVFGSGCSEYVEDIRYLYGSDGDDLSEIKTSGDNREKDLKAETPEVLEDSSSRERQEPEEAANTGTDKKNYTCMRDAMVSRDGFGADAVCGAAINSKNITDERLMEIVRNNFNAVTLENELKMDCMLGYSNSEYPAGSLHEEELNGEMITVPTLYHERADSMLDLILKWNELNPDKPLKVRGHVLVWHAQAPEWFFHEDYDASKDYVTAEILDKRLEWYIKSMLEYYTGKDSPYNGLFYAWDVVNEAISDSTGSYRTDDEEGDDSLSDPIHSIKSSWWKVYRNNEFILNAFKYANKYAPSDVDLYYNDYNECVDLKMEGIIKLISDVKDMPGARIDGFGMQGHYSIDKPTVKVFEEAVGKYGKVIGKIMITEMDVKAGPDYDGSDEALLREYEGQAEYYKGIFGALKRIEAEGTDIGGITTWGLMDKDSWLQKYDAKGEGFGKNHRHCPLLFDDDYNPKPVCDVFKDPLSWYL